MLVKIARNIAEEPVLIVNQQQSCSIRKRKNQQTRI